MMPLDPTQALVHTVILLGMESLQLLPCAVLITSQERGPVNQLFLPVGQLFSDNERVEEKTRYCHIKEKKNGSM